MRTNAINAAHAAARAGVGLAALADCAPGFVRAADLPADFALGLWILAHEDLRHTARIRLFLDFMTTALAADADLLEGRCPDCMNAPATG